MTNYKDLTDIDDIITLLKECDDAYFNAETGESPLLDREYDMLRRRAFAMNPSDDYFVKIGSSVRGGKTKLPYSMGSLNQAYVGDIRDWIKKYDLDKHNIVVTDKLDGMSALLIYNSGKLSIAYSRGDGFLGADITRHVSKIPNVPKTVDAEYLVVRAEIIMANDTFADKYLGEFKHARGMASGVMNRKVTAQSILNDLEVIVYEMVAGTLDGNDKFHEESKLNTLHKMNELGFDVVHHRLAVGSELDDVALTAKVLAAKNASRYELDGLVITVDNHASVDNQSKSGSLNPEHSVKYKILEDDDIVETLVVEVLWEPSKNAFLKPRVKIVPVELFGTTVTYATGFNARYIVDNGIGPGARIRITKSGAVIPFIVGVVDPVAPSLPNEAVFGLWSMNENGVEAVLDDLNSDVVVFKQVLDFFEKYKVENLKEATMKSVWSYIASDTYDEAILEICDLSESEWVKIVGANGSKIYKSLVNRLHNSAPETFYGACSYMGMGFGVRKAKALLEGIVDIRDDVLALTLNDIIAKDGFDVKTATNIVEGVPHCVALMDALVERGVLDFVAKQKATTEMTEFNVVMTGFRDAELEHMITSMGGKVGSGVSKKTTHLLCNDTSSTSSKMTKAKEFGCEIMTPDDFKLAHLL